MTFEYVFWNIDYEFDHILKCFAIFEPDLF